MTSISPLETESLRRETDASAFSFASTDDLEPLEEPLGQARAMEAARFALSVDRPGYNLVAVGPHGVGKHRTVMRLLAELAGHRKAEHDDCYVFNFEEAQCPVHLRLPAGRGRELVADMKRLVEDLQGALPAALESDEFRSRAQEIQEELSERAERVFEEAEKRAREAGIKMVRTPAGVAFLPMLNGSVISPDVFEKLSEDERKEKTKVIEELQKTLQEQLRKVPRWAKDARNQVRELKREVSRFAVGHSVEEIKERFADLPEVVSYLDAVAEDVVENADAFGAADEPNPLGDDAPFKRYQVNLLVDNAEVRAAPVIYDDNPTVEQLVGRIDHRVRLGNLISDFTLIRGGALHRANGGFLVLDARKLLTHTYGWQALKRALFSSKVRIEPLSRMLGLSSTATLEPEPIPLDVKVVLVVDRHLHMLLTTFDSEMADLFKVTADFDDQVPRDVDSEEAFARTVAHLTELNRLKPFDPGAVARLIEDSARRVGDANKLSTDLRTLGDLLVESDYLAGRATSSVSADHVQQAIDGGVRRSERVRERIHELIVERTLMVDTDGERVGQVNGLWVRVLGDFMFGAPARITATVRVGRGEVVDIEREAKLGGSIHSKGVLILSSYFASRFAKSAPLSLHASLVFEQSYSGIEGDSASLAELCCLVSALAELPIRQSFAMTGSVDQHGNVQPIGGVNAKIEGFFDVCRRRQLAGQGVIIPRSNVRNLMLRQDVVEACAAGDFHIYAVSKVDEAVELLTGVAAGAEDERGEFPASSVNGRVQAQLKKFAGVVRRLSAPKTES